MFQMSTAASANLLRTRNASNDQQFLQHSINNSVNNSVNNSESVQQGNVNFENTSDDELLLGEESESISTFGRTTMFYNERQQLRTALRNFFMNPFEKYTARGRVPWKLIFQVLKLICLTALLLLFGQDKFQLRLVLNAYQNNLGYLLIKDYEAASDRGAPGKPIVHRNFEIADAASHSLVSYFNLTNSSVGIFGFNIDENNNTVLPKLCITMFENVRVDTSQWSFHFDEKKSKDCSNVDCSTSTEMDCRSKVVEKLPKSYDGFISLEITFQIRSIFLSVKARPKCVLLYAIHTLRNIVMSGAIRCEFELTYDEVVCNESSSYDPQEFVGIRGTVFQIIINTSVIILSLVTGALVIKRIRTTYRLFSEARNFYHFHYNRRLTWSETSAFVNGWDIFSIFADVLTVAGVVCKILMDFEKADKHLDITAVLLGTAVGINWILALRFLSFDKGYYILVLTLSVAMPNILRLMICIFAIYLGYVLCGWAVFGPYTYKFASIAQTVDTLFAMLNGDEILDSFMQVTGNNYLLRFFSKIYFYSFIVLFIYVVLSVMISLIGDAMTVAQSAVRTGIGDWLIGVDVFPELGLGWSAEERETRMSIQQSGQNLDTSQNRL